jgi:hypothetical protein
MIAGEIGGKKGGGVRNVRVNNQVPFNKARIRDYSLPSVWGFESTVGF